MHKNVPLEDVEFTFLKYGECELWRKNCQNPDHPYIFVKYSAYRNAYLAQERLQGKII